MSESDAAKLEWAVAILNRERHRGAADWRIDWGGVWVESAAAAVAFQTIEAEWIADGYERLKGETESTTGCAAALPGEDEGTSERTSGSRPAGIIAIVSRGYGAHKVQQRFPPDCHEEAERWARETMHEILREHLNARVTMSVMTYHESW